MILLALLSTAIPVDVRSQPTAPPPSQKSQPDANAPTTNPPINITFTAPTPDPKIAQEERDDRRRHVEAQERIVKFTGLLIMVGLAQVIASMLAFMVATKAANTARKSAEVAERALVATQRPFLLNTSFDVGTALAEDGLTRLQFALTPRFVNSGHTPARRAECVVAKHVCSTSATDHVAPSLAEAIGPAARFSVTVGPGLSVTSSDLWISSAEIDQLLSNEAVIFLHAYMEYIDPFEHTAIRHTAVCARLSLAADPRDSRNDPAKVFMFHGGQHDHNYAD